VLPCTSQLSVVHVGEKEREQKWKMIRRVVGHGILTTPICLVRFALHPVYSHINKATSWIDPRDSYERIRNDALGE
jgi:hypothetical protein